MNRRDRRFLLLVSILIFTALLAVPASAMTAKPEVLTYEMWADAPDAVAFSGSLQGSEGSELTARRICVLLTGQKPCQHVLFEWRVQNVEGKSFTAVLRGTCHTQSGVLRLWGEISDGYMQGAKITARGRLLDAKTGHYRGVITIYPEMEGLENQPSPGLLSD